MPVDRLTLALAQISPVVGDIDGNRTRLAAARAEAAGFGADLVLAPELFLCGYPPEDLVLKPAFQEACRTACEALARETADGGPAVLVGLPWVEGGALYNAVALLNGGRIEAVRFKVDLPNYGVFDEKRVFRPGPHPGPIAFKGVRIGVPICEDIWGPDPVECILETGGEILLVPNASPYERNKLAVRRRISEARVRESGLPLIYLNSVGGQDELVFEGGSFALQADGSLACQLAGFRESVAKTVWERGQGGWRCVEGPRDTLLQGDEGDYAACVLGLRDYVERNRFPGVVLGLSGGIDSALCAAMAVEGGGGGGGAAGGGGVFI
jgi:NAD+ synthase